MPKTLTLHLLPQAWGLPTFRPDFLKAWAYMKLARVSFDEAKIPPSTEGNEEPQLDTGDTPVVGSDDILQHFRSEGGARDLDSVLTREQRAESFAFVSMIEGQLLNAMLYDWFMVEDNYQDVIRPLYAAAVPFPRSWYLPWNISWKMKSRLGYPSTEDGEAMYKQAEAVFSALSSRLADKDFFFGDTPSSLDAVFYGHVAVVLFAPMPEPRRLSSALQRYPNLVRLVDTISKLTSLPPMVPPPGVERPESTEDKPDGSKKVLSAKEKARRRRTRDFIAAGVLLTVGFLLLNVVFEIDAGDVD